MCVCERERPVAALPEPAREERAREEENAAVPSPCIGAPRIIPQRVL